MIERAELIAGVRAALRLLVGDPAALNGLECSIAGFWRSFRVMVLLAPTVLFSLALDRLIALSRLPEGGEFDLGPHFGAAFVSYVLGWIAFPLVLVPLARPLGLSARYVPFIVARNWSTVVGTAPYVLISVAGLLGVLPLTAIGPGTLAALGFNLWYSYRVTVIAAAVPPGAAAGLVALDFLLTLLVEVVVERLAGV